MENKSMPNLKPNEMKLKYVYMYLSMKKGSNGEIPCSEGSHYKA